MRVVRGEGDSISALREHKDASPEEREINEINSGIMAGASGSFAAWLDRVEPNNAQGELYLTDIVELACADGVQVLGVSFPMDTDYIAIPAVIVSVLTLVLVSLATAKPAESDWREFIEA